MVVVASSYESTPPAIGLAAGLAALVLSLLSQVDQSNAFEDASQSGQALVAFDNSHIGWIIDLGAIDHMTYDKTLFHSMTTPKKTNVVTANGYSNPVLGAGSIAISLTLSLYNTLFVPTLSNHLLSVSQVME